MNQNVNPNEDIQESQIALKSKRDQYTTEIRKKRTEIELNRRRRKIADEDEKHDLQSKINSMHRQELVELYKKSVDLFKSGLDSDNIKSIEDGLEAIRRIMSRPEDAPLDLLYEFGILPTISGLLDDTFANYHKVQHEAAWILANLASGRPKDTDYCATTLRAIEKFVNILKRPFPTSDEEKFKELELLKDQVVWGLCNIAGDSDEMRNKCLERDLVMVCLRNLAGREVKIIHLRNYLWLLSNLCRGKPFPSFEAVKACIPLFAESLTAFDDPEVLSYALFGLNYLSTDDDFQIMEVFKNLDLKSLIRLATDKTYPEIQVPAWRVIGNLLAGHTKIAEKLLENGLATLLYANLNSNNRTLRKETLWAMSNILANPPEIIQWILDVNEILPKVFFLLQNDDNTVKMEALHCLCNLTLSGTYEQVQLLLEFNVVGVMIKLLDHFQGANYVCLILEILTNLLQMGQNNLIGNGVNKFLMLIEREGGVKVIERLQQHPDPAVYTVINKIIDAYFTTESV